jgi:23S rRNA pseudouridine2605 synthase
MEHAFDKFINKEKNAKKKEAVRQEKRKWKEEKRIKYEKKNATPEKRNAAYKAVNRNQSTGRAVPAKQNSVPENFQKTHLSPLKTKDSNNAAERQPVSRYEQQGTEMPLNKFIAHAGICGRREAAELVKAGKIKVNNSIIYEPGYKVTAADKVVFNNKQVHLQKNLVYILLNKPKDYITTVKDTHGRKTVYDLIKHATPERVYSVGRLDRNTTGVLLLTNDGELTQKLTHPSFEVKKIYEVKLDKPVLKKDIETILGGIELEDGFIAADAAGYADTKDKSLVGIEIHSGRNRIVRRIFEHLGYDVKNLDRVLFANLTKKNVDRGKWRFLNEKEIRLIKYMNQSFVKKKPEH